MGCAEDHYRVRLGIQMCRESNVRLTACTTFLYSPTHGQSIRLSSNWPGSGNVYSALQVDSESRSCIHKQLTLSYDHHRHTKDTT